ncbi:hypothetical protein CFIMG_007659RA00001 [Ceratocystis fimbriata CBS 114723]|uniref:Transcription factor tau subunit sfc6 n=1 Tax=Ceratocystis fimbriata CBS 114723 TaxID=1035309 RepID=A0A2C5WUP3_9PEZI|nr:hypothetical protein CFIMG_007659RA00001 [Ceratocystis fimbriata CBS 114723]
MSSSTRSQRPRRAAAARAVQPPIHVIDDDDDDSNDIQISDGSDSGAESFQDEEALPKTPVARRRTTTAKSSVAALSKSTPSRSAAARAVSSPAKSSASKCKPKPRATPASARSKKIAAAEDAGYNDAAPGQTITNNINPNAIEPYPSQLTNRSYHGPLRLRRRIGFVLERFYGPNPADIKTAAGLINHWYCYDEAPVANPHYEPAWLSQHTRACQKQWLQKWKASEAYTRQKMTLDCGTGVSDQHRGSLKHLIVILDRTEIQMQRLQVQCIPRIATDNADESSYPQRPGWLLNLGGTVLDMTWAPKVVNNRQTLAVCIVPFGEDRLEGTRRASDGVVNILTFTGLAQEDATSPPVIREMSFPWGCSRRVAWCPQEQDTELGLLGVLSTEGQVHVLEIDQKEGYSSSCTRVASLFFDEEQEIKVTCFAWVGFNRIVTGHVDGSVCLWSIAPRLLLIRHPTHHSHVVDITTGYPSRPYLIASVPVAGLPTLVDFTSPGYESTSWALPSIVMQSTALQWHDDLQGFFINHPSSSPLDAAISFMHCRYFPHGPAVISSNSAVTAFSAGYSHPFILVGLRDGSLWCTNSIKKIFAARSEKPNKRKIMQHEFRPASRFPAVDGAQSHTAQVIRGASRLVSCDLVELNERKDKDDGTRKDIAEGDLAERGPAFRLVDPARAVNHEKETRVAAIAWNPVPEVSGWAVVAMASGLVQVVNLGVAPEADQ